MYVHSFIGKVISYWQAFIRSFFEFIIDSSVGVSNFRLVILQRQRRTKNRAKRLR